MPINLFQAHGQLYYEPKLQENFKMPSTKNTLMVRRNYKNPNTGNYDFDYIPIIAKGKNAEYIVESCNRLDYLYIIGRLITTQHSMYVDISEVDIDHQRKKGEL